MNRREFLQTMAATAAAGALVPRVQSDAPTVEFPDLGDDWGPVTGYAVLDANGTTLLEGEFDVPLVSTRHRGEWAPGTEYGYADMVQYCGAMYFAEAAHVSTDDGNSGPPALGAHWHVFADVHGQPIAWDNA